MSEYNRLTERGEPYYAFDKCKTCEYGKDGCDKWCDQTVGCFCRLQELENKIEAGTLVELPCKAGDTVYCIYYFYDVEEDFEYDIIPEKVVDIIVKEDDFYIRTDCLMIGKFERVCVCLTKAEAEQKIKELQEWKE